MPIPGTHLATPGKVVVNAARCRCALARSLGRWCAIAAIAVVPIVAGALDTGELVIIDRYGIAPRVVDIAAGGAVTFRVHENETLIDNMVPITVVFEQNGERSPELEPGESWTIHFPQRGVYDFRLEEHRAIEGTVIVE